MGIVLGQLGVMTRELWAESEHGQVIRAQVDEGLGRWDAVLWVSDSGIIEGHCGGQLFRHAIRGRYHPSYALNARIGGYIWGDTVRFDLNHPSRIEGTIGGKISGCRLQAEIREYHIVGVLQNRGLHQEQFEIQLMDVPPPLALMVSALACYFGYFLKNVHELS